MHVQKDAKTNLGSMISKRVRGRSTKYPNETLDERKARQRFATKQRVQKSRLRQKEMKALAAIQMQRAQESNCHNTLALLDAASRASELAALTPKRNAGRLWAPHEAEALRKGVEKYGMGKWQMILRDDVFGPVLKDRSNVDLKDKWRCLMGRTHLTVAASSALVELARQASTTDLTELDAEGSMAEEAKDLYDYAGAMSDAESEQDTEPAIGSRPLRAVHSHSESLVELASAARRPAATTSTPTAPPSPSPAAKRAPVSPKDSEDGASTLVSGGTYIGREEPMQAMQTAMEIVSQARQRAEEEIALAESFLHRARGSLTSLAEKEADLLREWTRLNRRRPAVVAAAGAKLVTAEAVQATTEARRIADTAHSGKATQGTQEEAASGSGSGGDERRSRVSASEASTSEAAEVDAVAHAMLALDDKPAPVAVANAVAKVDDMVVKQEDKDAASAMEVDTMKEEEPREE